MTLDALIEKAKAGKQSPDGVRFTTTVDRATFIALCEVAKAAKTMTWARQHRNDSWRTHKRVRAALAHLDDVMEEK